jgi:glycosyltransferase involved in cell wall biosynthesis
VHVTLLHAYRDTENRSMWLYARKLGESLGRRGVDVHHVCPGPLLPRAALRIGVLSRLDSLAGRFLVYPRLARGIDADVFHVVDHSQAHLLDHIEPSRTVVTCHDLILLLLDAGRIATDHRDRIAAAIFRRSVGSLRYAARVVAVSERTRRDAVELLGVDPRRIEVIPPGLNHPFAPRRGLRDATRGRYGLRRAAVLHVGHADFYKNVEGCLRVLARVRAAGIDAELVRVGEPLRPAQRHLASRLGLADHVRELGRLDADALAAMYVAADVLLFPSLYEGFGWPPLEAMASGLPVVCSNAGALPEVVADAARLADPLDEAALAEAVEQVCTVPAVAQAMRERGLRVAARDGWDATAARYAALYEQVLREAPNAR